ncbi:hypothetical protein Tco_1433935, partial [Tanacetum coccineum]
MMSSPNHSTFDIEDAFSSMNILNYTLVSLDYFPASSGSRSFNSSENSKDNMILPVFSPFYNNPYLKDVQAFYAKEALVSPPSPITPQIVLTSSPNSLFTALRKWKKDILIVRNKSSYDLILPTVLKELVLPVQRKMELENYQNNALAKLPMLKLGEYEMWEIRIKQYFQIQDYALWE